MKIKFQILLLLIAATLCQQCTDENLELRNASEMRSDEIHMSNARVDRDAFTMSLTSDSEEFNPELHFFLTANKGATIAVNWGDGITNNYQLTPGTPCMIGHDYGMSGSYNVMITGDLRNITGLSSDYYLEGLKALELRALVNLKELHFSWVAGPTVIDLSNNTRLEQLTLSLVPTLKTLTFPKKHQISHMQLDGPFYYFTHEDVDRVIDNIYSNAVARKIRDGSFTLNASAYSGDYETEMVGPPSAASIAKLRVLQDDFGWTIKPDLSNQSLRASNE